MERQMTESEEFQPGELVRLKSGGPKMAVVESGNYAEGFRVVCTWIDGNQKYEETFVPGTLERC
jgi:uncharacterized protein YodC (DUF2158 family)